MATTRDLRAARDLVRRVEELEAAVEELRKQAPRKAVAKTAEK